MMADSQWWGRANAGDPGDVSSDPDASPPLRSRLRAASFLGALSAVLAAVPAFAQDAFGGEATSGLVTAGTLQFGLFAGTTLAGAFFAWRITMERRKLAAECKVLRERASALARDNARLATLADAQDRRIVLWSEVERGAAGPALFGELPAETGAPADRATFLAFGRWMSSHSAGLLEHALAALRATGQSFDLTIETMAGSPLEVEGRSGGGGHFVRFHPAHSSRRRDVELRARVERLDADLHRVQALSVELRHPSWTRDSAGRLDGVNVAFARAVGCETPDEVLESQTELLGESARETIEGEIEANENGSFEGRLTTTVGGTRRIYRVSEAATPVGSAGIAIDVTEAEEAEASLTRTRRAHAETLDQLATAVASFDRDRRLTHWNNVFATLWDVDRAFLETNPSNSAVLDRFRADGKLADRPDWRDWVEETLAVYYSTEPVQHEWRLFDGRSLRVIAAPQEGGGVTWLFENVTEHRALEQRAKELQQMRDASLEQLGDGVAVFGGDGRLRLANPAFGRLWGLGEEALATGTHVSTIAAACADRHEQPSTMWADFAERITGSADKRRSASDMTRLKGEVVLSCSSKPLPRGHTMLAFVDISDTVRVADALEARNDAMQWAAEMQGNFLRHASYELRSPLTHIIGFTGLLTSGLKGPVTADQAEYLSDIERSSRELMDTVNQIVDLSTIDAGAMELDYETIEIDEIVAEAARSVEERFEDHDLTLDVQVEGGLGTMEADGPRIVQVLRNLLLNGIEHTEDGHALALSVARESSPDGDVAVFAVSDDGPGIPLEEKARVFEAFYSAKGQGRRRGPGLGLSVVRAFVELHGGTVDLQSGSAGTTVTCRVPVERTAPRMTRREAVMKAEPVQFSLPPKAQAQG